MAASQSAMAWAAGQVGATVVPFSVLGNRRRRDESEGQDVRLDVRRSGRGPGAAGVPCEPSGETGPQEPPAGARGPALRVMLAVTLNRSDKRDIRV
jgi:hypothetical protein